MDEKGYSNPATENRAGRADDHDPTLWSHRFGLLLSGV